MAKKANVELELQSLDFSTLQKILDQPPDQTLFQKVVAKLENCDNYKSPSDEPVSRVSWGYISPTELKVMVWDFVVMVTIYLFLFQMGFVLAFGAEFWIQLKSSNYSLSLYTVIISIFVIDIGVSFMKGYYQEGEGRIITDRARIVKNYAKKYLWIDVITLVSVILPLVDQSQLNWLQLVFLLKYFRMRNHEEEILRGLELQQNITLAFSLIVLVTDAGLVSHYIASIFLRLDVVLWNQQHYGDNSNLYWLSNNADYALSLIGGPWYLQYIYAQDYSTGTLSTLAPGPFPKNPIEVVYVNFVMIFLIILSSFLADGIVRIFYWETEQRTMHQTNVQSFINFLKLKGVSPFLKYRTQNYFEMVWEVEGKVDRKTEESAIAKLSTKLKHQLTLETMHLQCFRFLQYFKNHEKQLETELAEDMIESLTDANEVLFKPEGIAVDFKIFLISVGQAKLCFQNPRGHEIILGFTNTQKVLGVYETITQEDYLYTAKTIHLTHYHVLERHELMEIIEELNLKEQFCELKHRVQVERRFEVIGRCCLVCLGFHLERDCPTIMYDKRIRNLEALKDNSQENQRREYKRSKRSSSKVIGQLSLFNPLSILNHSLFDRYIHQILVYYEFQSCFHFLNYLPLGNLKALLH